ncbi:MAG: hypothetical protein KDA58_02510 [Planctomycetaceae bacterium]|nr:hypothetical protein [Planctomycetaceae bacterium]
MRKSLRQVRRGLIAVFSGLLLFAQAANLSAQSAADVSAQLRQIATLSDAEVTQLATDVATLNDQGTFSLSRIQPTFQQAYAGGIDSQQALLSQMFGLQGLSDAEVAAVWQRLDLVLQLGLNLNPTDPGPGPDPADDDALRLSAPSALETIAVPMPPDLSTYIKDVQAAKILGKALFWDLQVGSDGCMACASCHFQAGADPRIVNTVAPGPSGDFIGTNERLLTSDFPLHEKIDPLKKTFDSSNVLRDSDMRVGSAGVVRKNFNGLDLPRAVDLGTDAAELPFMWRGVGCRQVTGRNAPPTVNAIFFDRLFWDGRANRFFNGVNPFGDTDPEATVWQWNGRRLSTTHVLIENAAAASQAVGPPLSDVEMSWIGRSFTDLGKKMLRLQPLAMQQVSPRDSLLGQYATPWGRGLSGVSYSDLIKQAFQPRWWAAKGTIPGEETTQMEANFSLYWGLAIMMYESTLVSDDTPYDRWAKGDNSALTDLQKEGLSIFLNEGKCINCHGGPEFAGARFSEIRGPVSPEADPVEFMAMANGEAFYDNGFYNIGVRPTEDDLGIGAGRTNAQGVFIPWSITRRNQLGVFPDESNVNVPADGRVAVDGAFKTPSIRNVELSGPYMHNGSMATLEQVVEFYTRGTNFQNFHDKDPDVGGIDLLRDNPEKIAAVVAFMKSLTDDRVRRNAAPFDRPEFFVPVGHRDVRRGVARDSLHRLPPTGQDGGAEVASFEEILKMGGLPIE